jgi:hypothetical protein
MKAPGTDRSSTDQKGAIAESAIVLAAIQLGIGVLWPLSDGKGTT